MRIGILGGSFNPPHIGHIRLAVEAVELLRLDRVDFVPAAIPPHKIGKELLPFGLRSQLLKMAVEGLSRFEVNLLEAQRKGPSYTWDTLSSYRREFPSAQLFFLMGIPDLMTLSTWRRGLDLPCEADLVAVARQGMGQDEVNVLVRQYWPGATGPGPCRNHAQGVLEWRLPETGRIVLIHPPYLEVSSTLIRSYWQAGRVLRHLLPERVEHELERRHKTVARCWTVS